MNKKVLIISFSFEQEEEAFRVLEDAGLEPVLLAEKDRIGYTQEDLLDYWDTLEEKPAGILMGADIPLGKEFAEKAEGLEAISLNCAGADHLDLPAFEKKGIRICNVPRQNFNAGFLRPTGISAEGNGVTGLQEGMPYPGKPSESSASGQSDRQWQRGRRDLT